jgi:hypothetical protein
MEWMMEMLKLEMQQQDVKEPPSSEMELRFLAIEIRVRTSQLDKLSRALSVLVVRLVFLLPQVE